MIPLRIHQGDDGLDLIATLVVAALGGAVARFLHGRSGNLMVLVVLHTRFNDQLPRFVSPLPPQCILCVLAVGAIVWIEVSARHSGRMPLRRMPR
jgi:hypothetical protein